MSEFFAKISGQFTGPLLTSAFFPVLLFLTGLTLVVLPITPYGHDFSAAVQDPKTWEKNPVAALVLTIFVLVLSVVLYNLNTQVVRLYEGYPWMHSWIAKPFLWYRRRQFRRATLVRKRIKALRRQARLAELNASLSDAADSQSDLAQLLNRAYPNSEDLVLPTRLGNIIRAFETYTTRQYGMPAIALWPRLQPLIDGNLAQALDSVKTSFDFMIHSAFLSAILAVMTACAGLYWKTRTPHDLWQAWLAWTIVFGFFSYLFYLASLPRASEWGTQVKAGFDLYRSTLLSKLGYDLKPADLADERRIWDILNYKLAYPDERTYPDLPYKMPPSYLIVDPASTLLKSRRSVTVLADNSLQISVLVSNLDPAVWNADKIVLREEIPSGKMYVRDSALVNGAPAKLLAIDPLQIDLGPLPYYDSRTVVYRIDKAPA